MRTGRAETLLEEAAVDRPHTTEHLEAYSYLYI